MKQTRIDDHFIFTATNPVNGHIYNEYDAVIFPAYDGPRIIPALKAYHIACMTLGADSNHILSIQLMIGRVSLFQTKWPTDSTIIDRKFVFKAKRTSDDRVFSQADAIVFCAKDKALPAFINEYINCSSINTGYHYSVAALKDLLDRVMFYQENIESKVPDTHLDGEIQRCIRGIGIDNNASEVKDIRPIRVMEFLIDTKNSIDGLLHIPVPDESKGIYGKIFHVNDPIAQINTIFINNSGYNGSIKNWRRVFSCEDAILCETIKYLHNIPPEVILDVRLRLSKDNELVDFSKLDQKMIGGDLEVHLILEARTVLTIGDLLSLPEIEDSITKDGVGYRSSIFGSIVRIGTGFVFINITGKNESMGDWHRIVSMDDQIFIDTVRLANNIKPIVASVRIELQFNHN